MARRNSVKRLVTRLLQDGIGTIRIVCLAVRRFFVDEDANSQRQARRTHIRNSQIINTVVVTDVRREIGKKTGKSVLAAQIVLSTSRICWLGWFLQV